MVEGYPGTTVWVAAGKTDRDIAAILAISPRTVLTSVGKKHITATIAILEPSSMPNQTIASGAIAGVQRLLPQLEILDLPSLSRPAAARPAVDPLRHPVDQVAAVAGEYGAGRGPERSQQVAGADQRFLLFARAAASSNLLAQLFTSSTE